MGTRERRQREKEETRARILDAARELFATQGYEAVSMRHIAARIEYTATALYFHFKDKESLLRELCTLDFMALARQFLNLARVSDPVERLRKIGYAYVDFALKHPNQYRFMFMIPKPDVKDERGAIRAGNPEEDAYAFLRMTVGEAIKAGKFNAAHRDPDMVAQMAWAAVHGVVALHITMGQSAWVDWKPARRTARQLVDTIILGMEKGD